jgi:hypothetical protein
MLSVRAPAAADLPALTEIYNHYIVHTPITFDVRPLTPEERRPWFLDHAGDVLGRGLVPASRTTELAFQDDHRVHACRRPRRPPGGGERNPAEQCPGSREHQGIERAKAEEDR